MNAACIACPAGLACISGATEYIFTCGDCGKSFAASIHFQRIHFCIPVNARCYRVEAVDVEGNKEWVCPACVRLRR